MADIYQQSQDKQGVFAYLARKIPGFGGYLRKEDRRETDKILREHLAVQLEQVRARLDGIMRDLTDSGGLVVLGQADRIKKAMDKIIARIRFATYGYSGFFDVIKVGEDDLEKMYDFDMVLLNRIEELGKAISELAGTIEDHARFKTEAGNIVQSLRSFDEHLDSRTRAIGQEEKQA